MNMSNSAAGWALTAIFAVSLAGGAAAQPVIADPSFESPDVATLPGSFQYNPVAQGLTTLGNAGIAANGSAWNFADAPDGNQAGFLQSTLSTGSGWVNQAVSGLTPGVTYSFRFFAAQRPGYDINPIMVSFGRTWLTTFSPSSTDFSLIVMPAFVATDPADSLFFEGAPASGDAATAIDLVTVVPIATVADPSFETPYVGNSMAVAPNAPGVSFKLKAGIAGNGSNAVFPDALDGEQVGFVTGGSAIIQNVTGLTPGASYVVRFYLAQGIGAGSPIAVSYTPPGSPDNTPLGAFSAGAGAFTPVVSQPFTVPEGQTAGTLIFTDTDTATTNAVAIDMVAVVPLQPSGLADPSFETPTFDYGIWQNPVVPGVSFINRSGIATTGNGELGLPPAPDGTQVAYLVGEGQSASIIAQSVTGLTPGGFYTLRFFYAASAEWGPSTLSVAVDGDTVGNVAPTSTQFTPAQMVFSPNAPNVTLSFMGASSGSSYVTAIDAITLSPQ